MPRWLWATLVLALIGCKKTPAETAPRDCNALWTVRNGNIEPTSAECTTYVGTSAAGQADQNYWSGHYELRQRPQTTSLDLSATVSRPKSEEVYPIELRFLGGNFGVAQGRYFFYETSGQWTGWQATDVPFNQPLKLRVRQKGTALEGYINGALVGTYTMKARPASGSVGVFFKSAKGTASKVQIADVVLQDI